MVAIKLGVELLAIDSTFQRFLKLVYKLLQQAAMAFQKNNKLGAKRFLNRSLDAQPICFRGYEGTKEKLKTVPDWQERLTQFAEQLIEEEFQNNEKPS